MIKRHKIFPFLLTKTKKKKFLSLNDEEERNKYVMCFFYLDSNGEKKRTFGCFVITSLFNVSRLFFCRRREKQKSNEELLFLQGISSRASLIFCRSCSRECTLTKQSIITINHVGIFLSIFYIIHNSHLVSRKIFAIIDMSD